MSDFPTNPDERVVYNTMVGCIRAFGPLPATSEMMRLIGEAEEIGVLLGIDANSDFLHLPSFEKAPEVWKRVREFILNALQMIKMYQDTIDVVY